MCIANNTILLNSLSDVYYNYINNLTTDYMNIDIYFHIVCDLTIVYILYKL